MYMQKVISKKSFAYAEIDVGSEVRLLIEMKPAEFQSWLEASHRSNHTEVL